MTPLLAAEDLAIGHGTRAVSRGIHLALRPGTVTVLLGPNGGGKTTLLRTLLGLLAPLAGQVLLDGRDLARLPRAVVARRLAYVPQATSGGFAYKVREVVAMGRAAQLPLLAAPGHRDRELAEAALARLGVGHLADRPVTTLSGGERQLVLIARALVQEAACVVMDEPTASLDFGNQALVLEQVRGLAQNGLAVLLTTHHPDHAFLVADQVALLPQNGVLIGPGAPNALITAQSLRMMYGIETAVGVVQTSQGVQHACVPVLRTGRPACSEEGWPM